MVSIKNTISKCCNFCGLQKSEELSLLRSIAIDCGVEHDYRIVKVAQECLKEIYSNSDEYKELVSAHAMSPSHNGCDVSSVKINSSRPYGSPVSVSRFVGTWLNTTNVNLIIRLILLSKNCERQILRMKFTNIYSII